MHGPEYPKIQTVFKRDPKTNVIMPGLFTTDELSYLSDALWRWTEKIDGTNIRLHYDGTQVTIGGRTDNAQIPTSLIDALQKYTSDLLPWKGALDEGSTVTLYGEGYGAGIQNGGGNYIPNGKDFILFDVKIGDWWLKPDDILDVADKLGMHVVKYEGCGTIWDAMTWLDGTPGVEQAESAFPGVKIEGLVGQPIVPLFDRRGRRIITKLKVKDFEDLRASEGPRVSGKRLEKSRA